MRIARALVLALVACALAACGGTQGSGNVKTETRTVTGFNEVAVFGSGNVYIDQTGSESLAVEAEDNVLPLLESNVVNGRLTLGPRPGANINTSRPINYRVTVKELRAIDDTGSAAISGQHLNTQALAVTISGSGNVTPAGTATDQRVTISGSGSYMSEQLRGATGQLTISGSGQSRVNVSDSLDITINGSGSVRYLGAPRITQHVNGSGSVRAA